MYIHNCVRRLTLDNYAKLSCNNEIDMIISRKLSIWFTYIVIIMVGMVNEHFSFTSLIQSPSKFPYSLIMNFHLRSWLHVQVCTVITGFVISNESKNKFYIIIWYLIYCWWIYSRQRPSGKLRVRTKNISICSKI